MELSHCLDVFYQPMWRQSLRNAGCIHTVSAVFWYALHCRNYAVCPSTSEHCAAIKSQITEMKLLFTWWVTFIIFILPLWAVLVIQHIGQILKITSECYKWQRFGMNKFFKTLPKNTQRGNYCITCGTNTVHAKYHYLIYLQLTRHCCMNTEIWFCLTTNISNQ
jgi:hypothetical protein